MTSTPDTDFPPFVPKRADKCYLITCTDGPQAAELRLTHMRGHFLHIEKHWKRFITAGPVRETGGTQLVGSAFLLLADSLEQAEALMAEDPYISCGMYASIEYKELTCAAGLFIGGKIWDDREAFIRMAGGPPPPDTPEA